MNYKTPAQRKRIYEAIYQKIAEKINGVFFVCLMIDDLTNMDFSESDIVEEFPEIILFKEDSSNHAWLSGPYESEPEFEGKFYNYHHESANVVVKTNEFKLTVLALCIAMCE